MAKGWEFVSGSWNAVCDRCNVKVKADKLKKEWTGFMVCESCWEPRHSLDFVRSKADCMSVPWVRPNEECPETFNEYVVSDGIQGKQPLAMNNLTYPTIVAPTCGYSFVDIRDDYTTDIADTLTYSSDCIFIALGDYIDSAYFIQAYVATTIYQYCNDAPYVAPSINPLADEHIIAVIP